MTTKTINHEAVLFREDLATVVDEKLDDGVSIAGRKVRKDGGSARSCQGSASHSILGRVCCNLHKLQSKKVTIGAK